MIDVQAIQGLYRYNRWANSRILEALAHLTSEEFARDLGSSHPSVRATSLHIVWAEWIWLQRWNGVSPEVVFDAADFPNLDDVRARWSGVDIEQRTFLDALTDERLLAVVRYVNLKGETWQYPLWRQMCHVVNHSTYHRGQLTTMLRQLGARPIATDLLVFDDEQEPRLV
ncbi:MAG: DinB family protein [Vicinamibacterales bacterium]